MREGEKERERARERKTYIVGKKRGGGAVVVVAIIGHGVKAERIEGYTFTTYVATSPC